jgi:hypothetical protein
MSEHLSDLVLTRAKACLVAAAVVTVLALTAPAARAQTSQPRAFYIYFKVPGATQTTPAAINDFFTITGTSTDQKGTHGFLLDVFGKTTVFDAPGSISTTPVAINDQGTVTGTYQDANHVTHGFVRDPQGGFDTIDPTGSTNTNPTCINAFGEITGVYFTASGSEAFVRTRRGVITTFAPGGRAEGANLFGTVVGSMPGPMTPGGPPPSVLVEGFVRSRQGTITVLQDPSAGTNGTWPTGIDAFGDIVGFFINGEDYEQVFYRSAAGEFTTVAPPNSFQTEITGYNELGAIVGSYNEVPLGMGGNHNFVRDPEGNLTSFDVPQGGTPSGINNYGVIIGLSGTGGFLRVPY